MNSGISANVTKHFAFWAAIGVVVAVFSFVPMPLVVRILLIVLFAAGLVSYAIVWSIIDNRKRQIAKQRRQEEEAARRRQIEAAKRQQEEEVARRLRAEKEAARRQQEEEVAKRREEETRRLQVLEAAAKQRREEEAARRLQREEETARRLREAAPPPPRPKLGEIYTFANNNWLVLAVRDDKALLLSEYILRKGAYNEIKVKTTWENCTLRKFLNEQYYNSISQPDKDRIVLSTIGNPENLWYGKRPRNDTHDHVFLLSLHEADFYFGNSGDYVGKRRMFSTQDGKLHLADYGWFFSNSHDGKRVAMYKNKTQMWWLRSRGEGARSAAHAWDDGSVSVMGSPVNTTFIGVRPALWLAL